MLIKIFDVANACRIGEALIRPLNSRVDGREHVRLNGCAELNVAYDFRSLVFVREFGVDDVLRLGPLHAGFTLMIDPVEDLRPDFLLCLLLLLVLIHGWEWK
jgi:hypothetical protein